MFVFKSVAIVGRNGTGKTTLLKLLLEEINPDVGEIRIGSSVKIGYLSQHVYENMKSNVLEAFRECGCNRRRSKTYIS